MSKLIKLTNPKEIQAARDFIALRKTFGEHLAFVRKQQAQELQELSTLFGKRFRDCFVQIAQKHLKDPESAYLEGTHCIISDALEDFGDAYLVKTTDYEEMLSPKVWEPVDHSEALEERVIN